MPQGGPTHEVYVERGNKRVFAGALAWPGWCRSGRDEDLALEALTEYGPRFAQVIGRRVPRFRAPRGPGDLLVVERLKGDATTDFGAPSLAPKSDGRPIDAKELARLRSLLEAGWAAFDRAAVAAAGKKLRKGPRGGGRPLGKIVEHVIDAEGAYIRKLAVRPPDAGKDPAVGLRVMRKAALDALSHGVTDGIPAKGPRGGTYWKPRYFVRRVAWHALDHAWEIEDRSMS
jgi:DinB family protein